MFRNNKFGIPKVLYNMLYLRIMLIFVNNE